MERSTARQELCISNTVTHQANRWITGSTKKLKSKIRAHQAAMLAKINRDKQNLGVFTDAKHHLYIQHVEISEPKEEEVVIQVQGNSEKWG